MQLDVEASEEGLRFYKSDSIQQEVLHMNIKLLQLDLTFVPQGDVVKYVIRVAN